ncbi:MAG: phosphotransferase [Fibrobacter sp.]|nr:phosphotransferase [Fibrobacter sp.]
MNPIIININDYELSGGGKFGESYIKRDDPNILLKLYPAELEQMGLDEFDRAWKVYKTGLPCPEPGELVRTASGSLGIQFKRIQGKKSFARALSEHPEQLEKLAAEFAETCKKLHSTIPAPGTFPKAKDQYIQNIMDDPYLTSDEKSGLERFILGLPDADTAVHGDLHHGNIIFTEDGTKYLIDLSEFCTGTPWFDMGIIYRQTRQVPEEMEMELYHITKKLSTEFWNEFVRNYFGQDVSIKEIEEQALVYAYLRILVLERLLGRPSLQIRPEVHKLIGMQP